MTKQPGDLRQVEFSRREVQETIAELGYAVVSDSQCGPLRDFRTAYPHIGPVLTEDPFGTPPAGRLGAHGLVKFWCEGTGLRFEDYPNVPIPPRSYFGKPRLYKNVLPVEEGGLLAGWLGSALQLLPPALLPQEGSARLQIFRTGDNTKGKVVETIHRDDELAGITAPLAGQWHGAETSFYKPDTSRGEQQPSYQEIARVTLGVGDIALHDDIRLFHGVGPVLPLGRHRAWRDALLVAINTPKTYQYLQDYYRDAHLARH